MNKDENEYKSLKEWFIDLPLLLQVIVLLFAFIILGIVAYVLGEAFGFEASGYVRQLMSLIIAYFIYIKISKNK